MASNLRGSIGTFVDPYALNYANDMGRRKELHNARRRQGSMLGLQMYLQQMQGSGMTPQNFIQKTGKALPDLLRGVGMDPKQSNEMAQSFVDRPMGMTDMGKAIQQGLISGGFESEFGELGPQMAEAFKMDDPNLKGQDFDKILGYAKQKGWIPEGQEMDFNMMMKVLMLRTLVGLGGMDAEPTGTIEDVKVIDQQTGMNHNKLATDKEIVMNEVVTQKYPQLAQKIVELNRANPDPRAAAYEEQTAAKAEGDLGGENYFLPPAASKAADDVVDQARVYAAQGSEHHRKWVNRYETYRRVGNKVNDAMNPSQPAPGNPFEDPYSGIDVLQQGMASGRPMPQAADPRFYTGNILDSGPQMGTGNALPGTGTMGGGRSVPMGQAPDFLAQGMQQTRAQNTQSDAVTDQILGWMANRIGQGSQEGFRALPQTEQLAIIQKIDPTFQLRPSGDYSWVPDVYNTKPYMNVQAGGTLMKTAQNMWEVMSPEVRAQSLLSGRYNPLHVKVDGDTQNAIKLMAPGDTQGPSNPFERQEANSQIQRQTERELIRNLFKEEEKLEDMQNEAEIMSRMMQARSYPSEEDKLKAMEEFNKLAENIKKQDKVVTDLRSIQEGGGLSGQQLPGPQPSDAQALKEAEGAMAPAPSAGPAPYVDQSPWGGIDPMSSTPPPAQPQNFAPIQDIQGTNMRADTPNPMGGPEGAVSPTAPASTPAPPGPAQAAPPGGTGEAGPKMVPNMVQQGVVPFIEQGLQNVIMNNPLAANLMGLVSPEIAGELVSAGGTESIGGVIEMLQDLTQIGKIQDDSARAWASLEALERNRASNLNLREASIRVSAANYELAVSREERDKLDGNISRLNRTLADRTSMALKARSGDAPAFAALQNPDSLTQLRNQYMALGINWSGMWISNKRNNAPIYYEDRETYENLRPSKKQQYFFIPTIPSFQGDVLGLDNEFDNL